MTEFVELATRVLPGVAFVRGQVSPYTAAWAEVSRAALDDPAGPLWVAIGDSAALGVGAPAFDLGYVGILRRHLETRDGGPWRVVNLASSGAKFRDVLDAQLPALSELLAAGQAPALVTVGVGTNDVYASTPAQQELGLRLVLERVPPGSIVATMPQTYRWARARRLTHIVRTEAPRRGLRIADVWRYTGNLPFGFTAGDFFHPNQRGYGCWVSAFAEAMGLVPDPADGRPGRPYASGSNRAWKNRRYFGSNTMRRPLVSDARSATSATEPATMDSWRVV